MKLKKGAALLIVVLFIAIFGAVGVTITRAGLLNGIFTNNAIDAMIAEEASQSGLEVGLLHYKVLGNIDWPRGCYNLDDPTTGEPPPIGNGFGPGDAMTVCDSFDFRTDPKTRWVQITNTPLSGPFVEITARGHYGYVFKKHVLKQEAFPL